MVFFNHATRQMTAKIVYYGPGLCGKTTNLNTIYGKTSQKARGEMVSLNTETDRTLFFDLLPMDVGMVGGFKTKLQLYTVPGQVFYNSTRKLVLKGVDGIVFVVDSQIPMLDACRESWANLEENLGELGLNIHDIPLVFQWNKRDLKNVVPIDELETVLNPRQLPSFQTVASDGTGVFETLRGITKIALSHIKTHVLGEGQVGKAPDPAAPAVQAAPMPSGGGALTLSDLPSITDVLDLDAPYASTGVGSLPLPDEDEDGGMFIEAPNLPEPPAADDDITFLAGDENEDFPPAATAEIDFELPAAGPALGEVDGASEVPVEAIAAGEAAWEQPAGRPEPIVSVIESTLEGSLEGGEEALAPAPDLEAVEPGLAEAGEGPETSPAPARASRAVDPLAALASLKVKGRRPAAPPKTADPAVALSSLFGELTQVGRQGAPSVLRLEVPVDEEGLELEILVQVRVHGAVVAEGQVHRPAPGAGSTAKLTVELKRG